MVLPFLCQVAILEILRTLQSWSPKPVALEIWNHMNSIRDNFKMWHKKHVFVSSDIFQTENELKGGEIG